MQAYLARVLLKKRFFVSVKPNSPRNKILCLDDDILKVEIKAPADKNKANIELVKFISKELKPVRIVSGLTSRKKLLEFTD